ncbi:PIN domain-containing protein [Methylobacterium sp. R2-1]|uniref:PIN domain-containing protein n=1 Tax=Methylobacterium sp. R2-1 TaxID=2587064 RepID=UPI00161F8CA0|nr:hypothetical protein [Methylobacterium sp. R2-1]MBB2965169.1 tetratricopeptide (TPR) repeat protein [Methylobacterium sp. R2-1]
MRRVLSDGSFSVKQQPESVDPREIEAEKRIDAVRDLINDLSAEELLKRFERLETALPQPLSAKSRLRIGLNKGLCRLRMGDQEGAARTMLQAYEHDPNDPRAIAHKILGHWFLGEVNEACAFGEAALACDPSNDLAAFYLIQAQADLPDFADPMVGVPAGLQNNATILTAEIMVLRRREATPDWWARARAAAALHPEDDDLAALSATATVEEVTGDDTVQVTRILSEAQRVALREAQGPLDKAWRASRARLSDAFELGVQHLSVALVCARLLDDEEKLDELLTVIDEDGLSDPALIATAARILESYRRPELFDRLTARALNHPVVAFQVGLERVHRGEVVEGAHLLARAAIPPEEQAPVIVLQRLAALTTNGGTIKAEDLEALLPDANDDPRALALISQSALDHGHEQVAERAYVAALALAKKSNSVAYRATVAARAHNLNRPSDVIDLLDDLIAVRNDDRMLLMLARSHATERPRRARNLRFFEGLPDLAEGQYEIACHQASVYSELDRPEAVELARDLIRRRPDDAFAVALLVTALRAAGRETDTPDILQTIDLEALRGSIHHRFTAIHAFRRAGEVRRALFAAFAIVLAHPNDEQAVTGYLSLHWAHLLEGYGDAIFEEPAQIGIGSWVKLRSDHGSEIAFIIGEEAQIPGAQVFEPSHPLSAACMGLVVGESFDQEKYFGLVERWKVKEFKSKYLFLWQHLLQDFNQRFPASRAFMSIPVPENDVSSIEHVVRKRHEVMTGILKTYISGNVPLAMCARVVQSDPITLAQGVRQFGGDIRTSAGWPQEQGQAWAIGRRARNRGVVLDPYTAIVAAQIGALEPLRRYFGTLHTPASTLRLLDGVISRGSGVSDEGLWQLEWGDGALRGQRTPANLVKQHSELVAQARADILEYCSVEAVLLPDDAPADLVKWVETVGLRVMDSVSLSFGRSLPLLSDDLAFRKVAFASAAVPGLWLHAALGLCREVDILDDKGFVRISASLARHNHRHALLTPQMMQVAFDLGSGDDLADFRALSRLIGGSDMDPKAHAMFVAEVWVNLRHSVPHIEPLTVKRALGIMLDNYTRSAGRKLPILLLRLRHCLPLNEAFWAQITAWARGRFLFDEAGKLINHSKAKPDDRNSAVSRQRRRSANGEPRSDRRHQKALKNRLLTTASYPRGHR